MKNSNVESDQMNQKKRPTCAKCANHNILVRSKGHKRHCEYRYCMCGQCNLTKLKRDYMAKVQYIKRNMWGEILSGKRVDIDAIVNERMKMSKKKAFEAEKMNPLTDEEPKLYEQVQLKIQDIYQSLRTELKINCLSEIFDCCLVALIQQLNEQESQNLSQSILNIYLEMNA